MKKIRKGTNVEDAAKVTALVAKLNRYRYEYYKENGTGSRCRSS